MKLTLTAAAFVLIVLATQPPEKPRPVRPADFTGRWAMQWGELSRFEQIFRADGTSDCLGEMGHSSYFGTWTSAKQDEITVAETCYSVPNYEKAGPEIEFTLAVKKADWKDGKLSRVELEGEYQCGTVKVVLVREP